MSEVVSSQFQTRYASTSLKKKDMIKGINWLAKRIKWMGLLALLFYRPASAQHPATVKEYEKSWTTYPFSDPDPVPNAGSIYPYFRFDGFTDKPRQQKWKVVELDNDFIRVLIMPQIGGKIWTAIDKKNGKPFLYDNDAVKFRDIAMRGPWTSGGIEMNYGIIGHTPAVASPVDYITRKNEDGSASCVISVLDLLTQTRWSLEIRLPEDKAYFITKSVWHNGTPTYQPYYSWLNVGEKVSDSLEYIFPGNHYIYHDGKAYDWPYDEVNHKPIFIYNQNDFGGSKSYHVTGTYSKYYGTFWQKENFGMIHYAPRQDKIGKKIWIWGLSGQGMIWEKMLTDHSGQYTEVQSGRLYNQNAPASVFTPFKQFYFQPYHTDTWEEYWYPFEHTGGVTAADLNGVFHLKKNAQGAMLSISPVSYIHDTLKVLDTAGNILFSESLTLRPLQSWEKSFALPGGKQIGSIRLAGSRISLNDSAAKALDRPVEADSAFDWESAYGLFLRGRYEAGTHHYAEAKAFIQSSLDKEPYFMPALTTMSYLQYREMHDDSAFYYARKALGIDTYDPAANYYYGLAALRMNKRYDALDGFQVAALTPEFRSAAYTEISLMDLQDQRYEEAYQHASEALVNNTENITALQLQYVAARKLKQAKSMERIKGQIHQLDPLNHFIRFENYWQNETPANKQQFTGLIRDELPQQTYLHLADWYMQLNLFHEAESVLALAPEKDDEMKYWLAYLHREDENAKQWLDSADAGSPLFVFPFRPRSADIMRWAMTRTDDWKPEYYLALIERFTNNKRSAAARLDEIRTSVKFAPFYVTRAGLRDSSEIDNIIKDYTTALSLDRNWRYAKYLAEFLMQQKQEKKALDVIRPYYNSDPDNYLTGVLYVRCLILNDRYAAAEKVLGGLHILPFEGATTGHVLYRKVKLMLALGLLQQKQYQQALRKVAEAREWPEHLGVGKPYPEDIDDRLENEIEGLIKQAMQTRGLSSTDLSRYEDKVRAL